MIDDRAIVRRMVLKRCVYGVDKNPMAVELAKVALWLHTLHRRRAALLPRPSSALRRLAVRRVGAAGHGRAGRERRASRHRRHSRWRSRPRPSWRRSRSLTDADMAEAARVAVELRRASRPQREPLRGFLDFWHALRWLDLSADEEKAVSAPCFDGAFGDPCSVAGGLRPPDAPSEEALISSRSEGAEQASLLASVRGQRARLRATSAACSSARIALAARGALPALADRLPAHLARLDERASARAGLTRSSAIRRGTA